MANHIYTTNISGNSSNYLTAVTINSVSYPIGPIPLDITITGIATTIQNALNGLGFGAIFTVTIVSTNFHVASLCGVNIVNSLSTVPAGGGGSGTTGFSGTNCGALLSCTGVTATITGQLSIDCINGISFTDTTGAYSGSNQTGYGSPNTPAISAILSTIFNLYDSTGSTLLGTYNSSYVPDASGTVGTPLTATNFGLSEFTKGVTYTLSYSIVITGPSTKTCLIDTFTAPCCGATIPSNLGAKISVTENIGNGSLTFADTTGAYDATTNTGGYGGPNFGYGDITSTLIRITLEDGSVINFTTFKPTSPTANTFLITAAMLGYTSVIVDQIIQVTYIVYTGGQCQIGYANRYELLYGLSQNCINNQIQGLLDGTCSCNDEGCDKTDYITKMLFELDAIKIASQGNIGCVAGKIQAYYLKCSGGCSSC